MLKALFHEIQCYDFLMVFHEIHINYTAVFHEIQCYKLLIMKYNAINPTRLDNTLVALIKN